MLRKTDNKRSKVLLAQTLCSVRSRRMCGLKITEFAVLISLVFLAGCASTPNKPEKLSAATSMSVDQELEFDMVNGLVAVVPQLLEPLSTTIQFNGEQSGDIEQVLGLLAELSYGLQRVNADQGKHFLYLNKLSSEADTASDTTRLRLSLGAIELTRSFRIINKGTNTVLTQGVIWRDGRGVVATSPLQVAGTRLPIQLTGIELDESIVGSDSAKIVANHIEYTSSAPIEGGIPTISLITSELVQQVADSSFPSGGIGTMFVDSFEAGSMTHVADGAFASVADNYERVGRETIIFPNDSEFLGRSGKLQVKKVLAKFSGNTDLVGIVGCSNGYTKLAVGNEGLALGRAKRIAEEFYTAGMAREKVFNEGCWSTERGAEGFPNRGVVIDLWRRKV